MIHKQTWPGLAETLLVLWVAFLLLTTRLPSSHFSTPSSRLPINPTVEADAVRTAIDSGRKELGDIKPMPKRQIQIETAHPFGGQ